MPETTTPAAAEPGARLRRAAPLLVALAVGVVLLGHASPWLGARFGENHEGRNAAVWGSAAEVLREEGVVDSRFGGLARTGTYANHPPGIIAETATAELIAGQRRIATRAPAWLGSIVAVALLTVLLLEAGLPLWAAVAGIAVSCTSAMFLVYGTMLDTPVTSLPFSLAVLVVAQRAVQDRPTPAWTYAVLGGLAAVSGWQAVTFTLAAGAWMGLTTLRRRQGWAPVLALAGGSAVGIAVTAAWIRWVYDGLDGFSTNARYRMDESTLSTALSSQLEHTADLLPIAAVLGAIGIVLALTDRSWRALALVTVLPVVGYALVFRGASEQHDYWNFAFVAGFAVGTAVLAVHAERLLRPTMGHRATAAVVGLTAVLAVCSVAVDSDAEVIVRNSVGTPALVDVAASMAAPEGPVVSYLSQDGAVSAWITYESGRPGRPLAGLDELHELAREEPGAPILVVLASPRPEVRAALTEAAVASDGPWAILSAEDADRAYAPARVD